MACILKLLGFRSVKKKQNKTKNIETKTITFMTHIQPHLEAFEYGC